jgi:sugar phosphate isomerase/epimerase
MNYNIFRLCLALLVALASCDLAAASPTKGPFLGLQSWTCRNMTFDQVVAFASSHGIKYLELYPRHLDPAASKEESLRKKAILEQHGLIAYSFGVNLPPMEKEKNRALFEFARLMGMKLIIVEPQNLAAWDGLEELVKEYDIKLAIHNHGLGTPYGDPAVLRKVLAARDPRIGICLDVGHVTKAGFDAAKVFHDYGGDRVFDLHFKDKAPTTPEAKASWIDTFPGAGKVNYPGLFAEIKRSNWSGVMAIETDSDEFALNPGPLVEASQRFFTLNLAERERREDKASAGLAR